MVKRCVAAGCSHTHADGISFPRDPSLRAQWNKQVQRTRVNWRDATNYSVLCGEHFTKDCFEQGSVMASQFGTQKTIFNRPARGSGGATTENQGNLQEGPSIVGNKRSAVTGDKSILVEQHLRSQREL